MLGEKAPLRPLLYFFILQDFPVKSKGIFWLALLCCLFSLLCKSVKLLSCRLAKEFDRLKFLCG
ncbi:hypothetical protein [Candidatus Electronema sp. PJ]|uniref:hypothetical protein n=1 Tax=Candidatus Electronema sp. PJ TaxID=3401572 RepID=UPI003AA8F59D